MENFEIMTGYSCVADGHRLTRRDCAAVSIGDAGVSGEIDPCRSGFSLTRLRSRRLVTNCGSFSGSAEASSTSHISSKATAITTESGRSERPTERLAQVACAQRLVEDLDDAGSQRAGIRVALAMAGDEQDRNV